MSSKLETRRMGRTEMRPNALALGAAWIYGRADAEVIAAIRRATELGMNYIDTYPGHSEHLWGEALSGGLREKIYLQAKVGTHPERRKDFSADGTRWSVTNSLKDFRTDYLDAVLIHDPLDMESVLDKGRALDTLLEMKEEGLIRNIGAGVRSHEFHKTLIETGHIDIILTFLDYTLLSQSVAQTTLPLAREHDVGIILASPLGMGSLTGAKPNVEEERRRNPDAEPKAYAMWKWCQERDVNIRHLAMQFCLAAPIDGVVMFGPANIAQVEDGYEAATTHISEEIWQAFEAEFGIRRGT
ncbi:aldo/keto reductase [Candidatus Poribacteria bacterium]|nr:aldo/keto reductase [Candidatus Poribacteria bacterium]MYB65114.1 aldo/keto reductase [Candidatus Poribacteria bacterium]MYF56696.1 aldo/keto reductase [Candidatus Poribacteria bacterium]MYI93930.1 aldo/keto reductase [Candidatus Poribacteria bacterium]